LIRKIIDRADINPETEQLTPDSMILDAVMQPTRIYVKSVLKAMATDRITGAVHVTGGGFQENLPRSFGKDLAAHIDLDTWERPAIFKWLEAQGDVGAEEMLRTFNCGIGFIMFCAPEHVAEVTNVLASAGEQPIVIGELTERKSDPVVFSGAFA
jgi:phosphoribosylformylglycinamidine cyclo-ligase